MQIHYTLLLTQYGKINIKSYEKINSSFIIEAELLDVRLACSKCNSCKIHIDERKKRLIKDVPYMDNEVIINLEYFRYKCYSCKYKFTQQQDIVNTNHKYSINAIKYCINQFFKMRSGKDISNETFMSTTTVWRCFDKIDIIENLENITGLYIDEFKGNAGNEKYQLTILNQDKKLIAVLDSRRTKTIQKFFDSLDKSNIKFIVADLFKPFRHLFERNFPNARIIADPYHYFRQVNWCIRDRRIALYNSCDKEYKDFKKYWKLFVINPLNLSDKQSTRLESLLEKDDSLSALHKVYIDFYLLHRVDILFLNQKYDELLDKTLMIGCEESKRLHSTLKSWKLEICNAIKTKLSNGVIEGLNNKTKVIKRISYGIRKHETYMKMMHLRMNSSASIIITI
ncbi:MAG: ISL3 family transposase [Shewanella sp.]